MYVQRTGDAMKVYFIRHGKTKGNWEGRYVGRTDEALLPESAEELKQRKYPLVDMVVTSPMLRCRQTAGVIYPGTQMWVQPGLQEMDFGRFEYKNYQELNGSPAYQAFIDSNGETGFPGGESVKMFRERCCEAFCDAMDLARAWRTKKVALIGHGGTIMAILEAYGIPRRSFYEWQIENGGMIEAECDEWGKIFVRE